MEFGVRASRRWLSSKFVSAGTGRPFLLMPPPLLNPPLGLPDQVMTLGATSGGVSPASAKDRFFCPPMAGLAWFEFPALFAVQTGEKMTSPSFSTSFGDFFRLELEPSLCSNLFRCSTFGYRPRTGSDDVRLIQSTTAPSRSEAIDPNGETS